MLPDQFRLRFRHTLVVHESDLPQGKGWSPLTWQILAGQVSIPVTLFEAVKRADSGPIYAQRWLHFEGHELIDELRAAQAGATSSCAAGSSMTTPRASSRPAPRPVRRASIRVGGLPIVD